MSILKRPGWNNYEVLEEGRLHNDKLKERIGKMFDRLSLGYSPNHVVDKISSIIRHEKGDKMDISKVSDEYIMSIATSDSVTRGKFTPSLKPSYVSAYQNTNAVDPSYSEPEESTPITMNFTATSTETPAPVASIPTASYQEDSEDESDEQEDAEEVETCGCEKKKMVFNPEIAKKNIERVSSPDKGAIKKESVKLSPTAVNKLLKENFVKSKQHKFKYEEKYRMY
jgi:predicted DNA binding CopG/RHH family protein